MCNVCIISPETCAIFPFFLKVDHTTDPLTGLLLRRWSRNGAARHGTVVSLVAACSFPVEFYSSSVQFSAWPYYVVA
jgi:hypothetical protein